MHKEWEGYCDWFPWTGRVLFALNSFLLPVGLGQKGERNCTWVRAVIPNLGYVYPQGYEPGHLEVREKNWIVAEKGTYVSSVSKIQVKSCEINGTLWRVAEIIWRVKFMEIGCQGVRKWKKLGNRWVMERMMNTFGVDSSRPSAAKPTYVGYLPSILSYVLTYLLHGAESFLRS